MATSRDIWEQDEWVRRRAQCNDYERWYDGTRIGANTNQRNRDTGDLRKKFPLGIRLTELLCDLHRDLARGMPRPNDPLIVRAMVERGGPIDESAERIEQIINNGVWRASHGAPIQQEGLLAMNIYGATAYKLSWEPWDVDLPHRLAVRHIRNPAYLNPIWDPGNQWRLLECYYGREIDASVAKAKYNITANSTGLPVLYMEHWTRESWSITVDDKVPTMTWGDMKWELQGPNPWGFVPIYYIPHERTTDLFGESQIDGVTELEKDVNSKMATLSDTVKSARPSQWWGHDLSGSTKMKKITCEGQVIGYVLDVGRTRNIQGAQAPFMGSLPMPDIPEAIAGFPQDLLTFWMMVARISPASFGLDDTQSGRITGPVAANRMWSSMAHATTERINYSEAKTIIDRDILRILNQKSSEFAKVGVEDPQVTREMLQASIRQNWPPMIPMDKTTEHTELIERLKEGGISPEEYQDQVGTTDVDGEIGRILEWKTQLAEIEAKAQPAPFGGGGNESGNQSQDQAV